MKHGNKEILRVIQSLSTVMATVISAGQDIQIIGNSLPATSNESNETLHPELIFPALARALIDHANTALSLIDQIESHFEKI